MDDYDTDSNTHQRILDWRRTSAQTTPCPLLRNLNPQPNNNVDGDAPIDEQQAQAPPANTSMTISFRDANGTAVDFKMKSTTKLGKAMAAFSNKMGRDVRQLRFLFDGERVAEHDTPTTVSLPPRCGCSAVLKSL